MWLQLREVLNSMLNRLRESSGLSAELESELQVMIKYTESSRADSRQLAYLLVVFYAKLKTDDLELNSMFYDAFYAIGEEACTLGTYAKVLKEIQ